MDKNELGKLAKVALAIGTIYFGWDKARLENETARINASKPESVPIICIHAAPRGVTGPAAEPSVEPMPAVPWLIQPSVSASVGAVGID